MTQHSDEKQADLRRSVAALTPLADALERLTQGQTVTVSMEDGSVTELSVTGTDLKVTWIPAPEVQHDERDVSKKSLGQGIRAMKKHLSEEERDELQAGLPRVHKKNGPS